jgi:hypothetical protein
MKSIILKDIERIMSLLENFNDKIIEEINNGNETLEIIELATKSNLYTLLIIKIHQDLNNENFLEDNKINIIKTLEMISNFCIKYGEKYV